MEDIFYVENLTQLKALSDPFKIKILWEIDEIAKTGKMLADELELSPSKVRYHLTELEKVGLITIERTEEKNGIIQKFYRSTAKIISLEKMIPYINKEDSNLSEGLKESMIISLKRASRILSTEKVNASKAIQISGEYFLDNDEIETLKEMFQDIHAFLKRKNTKKNQKNKHHINLTLFQIVETDGEDDG